ncbi:MAG: hypothetical protein V4471_07480 [Pseudomonadota bacterium]
MNYLCCPVTCVVNHIRWLSQLCNNLFARSSNSNERWTLLEESYQETPMVSRSRDVSFFQTPQSDPIPVTTNLSPVCKN